jgi:hypothetical protein
MEVNTKEKIAVGHFKVVHLVENVKQFGFGPSSDVLEAAALGAAAFFAASLVEPPAFGAPLLAGCCCCLFSAPAAALVAFAFGALVAAMSCSPRARCVLPVAAAIASMTPTAPAAPAAALLCSASSSRARS